VAGLTGSKVQRCMQLRGAGQHRAAECLQCGRVLRRPCIAIWALTPAWLLVLELAAGTEEGHCCCVAGETIFWALITSGDWTYDSSVKPTSTRQAHSPPVRAGWPHPLAVCSQTTYPVSAQSLLPWAKWTALLAWSPALGRKRRKKGELAFASRGRALTPHVWAPSCCWSIEHTSDAAVLNVSTRQAKQEHRRTQGYPEM